MEQIMYDLEKGDAFVKKLIGDEKLVRGPASYAGENRAERRKRERAERKAAKRVKAAA